MQKLGSLLIEVATNVAKFQSDMSKMSESVNSFAKRVDSASKFIRSAFQVALPAIGLHAVISKLINALDDAVEHAARLKDLSDAIGISTEALSTLEYIAIQSGTTFESLASAIAKMEKNLSEAVTGSESAQAAFAALQLNARELISLSPDEAFGKIAKAVASVQNPMERVRVAMEIFGKNAANILPAIIADAKGLADEFRRTGAVVSTDFAEHAHIMQDRLDELKTTMRGLVLVMAESLVPVITDALVAIKNFMQSDATKKFLDFLHRLIMWHRGYAEPLSGIVYGPRGAAIKLGEKQKVSRPTIEPQLIFPEEAMSTGNRERELARAQELARRQYEEEIDLAMRKMEEERALIKKADSYYEDARKAQEARMREEAELEVKLEEEKWQRILSTHQKMSMEQIDAYVEYLRKMGATEDEMIAARRNALLRHTDDSKVGIRQAFIDISDDIGTESQRWYNAIRDTATLMANAITEFATSAITDFRHIGDAFRGLMQSMLADIGRTFIHEFLTQPLVSAIGGFLGLHSGGIVGETIPSYHAGGVVRGSSPQLAILHPGEVVVPKLHSGLYPSDSDLQALLKSTTTVSRAANLAGQAIPAYAVSPWNIPQFGFYGQAIFDAFGLQARSGASIGMPINWYEKYGEEAELNFMTRILSQAGVEDEKLKESLRNIFGGGIAEAYRQLEAYREAEHPDMRRISGMITQLKYSDEAMKSILNVLVAMSSAGPLGPYPSQYLSMRQGVEPIDYAKMINAFTAMNDKQMRAFYAAFVELLTGVTPSFDTYERIFRGKVSVKQPVIISTQDLLEYIFGEQIPEPIVTPEEHANAARKGRGKGPGGKRFIFHSGGLAPDETLAVLQRGEAVIPRRVVQEQRELVDYLLGAHKYHDGGMVQQQPKFMGVQQQQLPNIQIVIENRSGTQLSATSGQTAMEHGRVVARMVVDEIMRDQQLRGALRGI